jgi:hypothetical protein
VPREGRRVFVGKLESVEENGISVVDQSGVHVIAFAEIAQANYEAEL